MSIVEEIELPGLGRRFEVVTDAGDLLIIVVHDSGTVELYDARSGDRQKASLVATLKDDEARLVAAIIGRTIYRSEAIERLGRHGVGIAWLQPKADSYGVGRTVGELLQNTGVSVLVVIEKDGKRHNVLPADYVLQEGCQLALAGGKKEIQALKALIEKGT